MFVCTGQVRALWTGAAHSYQPLRSHWSATWPCTAQTSPESRKITKKHRKTPENDAKMGPFWHPLAAREADQSAGTVNPMWPKMQQPARETALFAPNWPISCSAAGWVADAEPRIFREKSKFREKVAEKIYFSTGRGNIPRMNKFFLWENLSRPDFAQRVL